MSTSSDAVADTGTIPSLADVPLVDPAAPAMPVGSAQEPRV